MTTPSGRCTVSRYTGLFDKDNLAFSSHTPFGPVIGDTAERAPRRYHELTARKVLSTKVQTWPHVLLANGRIICKDRAGNVQCHILTHQQRDTRGP